MSERIGSSTLGVLNDCSLDYEVRASCSELSMMIRNLGVVAMSELFAVQDCPDVCSEIFEGGLLPWNEVDIITGRSEREYSNGSAVTRLWYQVGRFIRLGGGHGLWWPDRE